MFLDGPRSLEEKVRASDLGQSENQTSSKITGVLITVSFAEGCFST